MNLCWESVIPSASWLDHLSSSDDWYEDWSWAETIGSLVNVFVKHSAVILPKSFLFSY